MCIRDRGKVEKRVLHVVIGTTEASVMKDTGDDRTFRKRPMGEMAGWVVFVDLVLNVLLIISYTFLYPY